MCFYVCTCVCVCIYVHMFSFFILKGKTEGWGEIRERRNKDDFRILSLGDWKSNGIISRSKYSKREVFWRGRAKPCPNETDLFSLVKATRQKQARL